MSSLLVFLGGGAGAVLRHGVNAASLRWFGPAWPYGTFAVNVAGSLAMGLLIGWLVRRGASNDLRLALATGLLGGFTTFSAFSLDALNLWERGAAAGAAAYVLGTVALSLLAVALGLAVMR